MGLGSPGPVSRDRKPPLSLHVLDQTSIEELGRATVSTTLSKLATSGTITYASDWKQFTAWCERYRLQSLPAPAGVIALYLTSLAKRGLTVSTIRRRAAAIGRAHRQAGHLPATTDPRVLTVMEGIVRVHGTARIRRPRCCATRCSS